MKKLIALTLALVLFFSTNALSLRATAANTYSIDTPYTYPIVPGTDAWEALETRIDMAEACMIPEDILSEMTTNALLETILDYPLLIDIIAYNSPDVGVSVIRNSFNGLEELLLREDFSLILNSFSLENSSIANATDSYKITVAEFVLNIFKQMVYGASPSVRSIDDIPTPELHALRTPRGSAVPAYYKSTFYYVMTVDPTRGDAATIIREKISDFESGYARTYPSAVKVAGAHPEYNCHSYALYGNGSANSYWINNPYLYYTDGSLTQATATNHRFVLYSNPEMDVDNAYRYIHTAVYLDSTYYQSKWGFMGVYKHTLTANPYSVFDNNYNDTTDSDISYWNWAS